jgi:phage gp36-like protein
MTDERTVRMAAKLYEAREALQDLFGDAYAARMELPRKVIRAVMERHACSALEAVLRVHEDDEINEHMTIQLLAAAVDVSEGKP